MELVAGIGTWSELANTRFRRDLFKFLMQVSGADPRPLMSAHSTPLHCPHGVPGGTKHPQVTLADCYQFPSSCYPTAYFLLKALEEDPEPKRRP